MSDNDDVFKQAKLKLEGRIYPAIQRCVSNQYRILLGIFAFYSFIISIELYDKPNIDKGVVTFIASIIFSLFVLHNAITYWLNASTQYTTEDKIKQKDILGNEKRWGIAIEVIFGVLTFGVIWLSRWLFAEVLFAISK